MGSVPDMTVGNRFAHYTTDDHNAVIWVGALLSLTYVFMALMLRYHIKWKFLGFDDWILFAATFLSLGQFVAIFIALGNGLGKVPTLLSAGELEKTGEAVITSETFAVVALSLAKCSVAALIARLFTRDLKGSRLLCDATLAACLLWGLGGILALSVRCTATRIFFDDALEQCPHEATAWKVLTAFDVLTEVVLLALPAFLISKLQMSVILKIRVLVAFAFRLPVIVFAILHATSIYKYSQQAPSTQSIVPSILWLQVQIGYSLVAATIPNLKAFIKSFDTGMGFDMGVTAYGSNGLGNTYQLSSLKSRTQRSGRGEDLKIQGDVTTVTSIYHSPEGAEIESLNSGSRGSQDMIIRREVQYEVRVDNQQPGKV